MTTVLIVDDRAANRDVPAPLLHSHGRTLLQAADGGQGLAAGQASVIPTRPVVSGEESNSVETRPEVLGSHR